MQKCLLPDEDAGLISSSGFGCIRVKGSSATSSLKKKVRNCIFKKIRSKDLCQQRKHDSQHSELQASCDKHTHALDWLCDTDGSFEDHNQEQQDGMGVWGEDPCQCA